MAAVQFKLPRGIAGVNRDPQSSDKSFSRFKLACHEVARRANGRASGFVGASVTPSFHQAELRFDNQECSVVCNAAFGIVAFASVSANAKLDFLDYPELSKSFKLQGYKVLGSDVLSLPLDKHNCADLDEAESREVEYWRCDRVGEVIFNWFD